MTYTIRYDTTRCGEIRHGRQAPKPVLRMSELGRGRLETIQTQSARSKRGRQGGREFPTERKPFLRARHPEAPLTGGARTQQTTIVSNDHPSPRGEKPSFTCGSGGGEGLGREQRNISGSLPHSLRTPEHHTHGPILAASLLRITIEDAPY